MSVAAQEGFLSVVLDRSKGFPFVRCDYGIVEMAGSQAKEAPSVLPSTRKEGDGGERNGEKDCCCESRRRPVTCFQLSVK